VYGNTIDRIDIFGINANVSKLGDSPRLIFSLMKMNVAYVCLILPVDVSNREIKLVLTEDVVLVDGSAVALDSMALLEIYFQFLILVSENRSLADVVGVLAVRFHRVP